jgi:hypothetical protein
MRGTVGAGKTTLANFIKTKYKTLGYKVYNEGTDKYCKTGMHTGKAINLVKQVLANASKIASKCIVIIDTCGEFKSDKPFDVDFSGWKTIELYPNLDRTNLMGYLAWSLTNVLNRGPCASNTDFYLSSWAKPGKAGIDLCKDVHQKKAKALGIYDDHFNNIADTDRQVLAAQYAATIKPLDFDLSLLIN